MKAKDWTWPKRLADSPHPSPLPPTGDIQPTCHLQDTNEAIETLDKTIGLAQAAGDMQDICG